MLPRFAVSNPKTTDDEMLAILDWPPVLDRSAADVGRTVGLRDRVGPAGRRRQNRLSRRLGRVSGRGECLGHRLRVARRAAGLASHVRRRSRQAS